MTGKTLRDWNTTPQYGDGAAFIRCKDPTCPCRTNPKFLRDPLPPAGQHNPANRVKVHPSPRVVQDDPNKKQKKKVS